MRKRKVKSTFWQEPEQVSISRVLRGVRKRIYEILTERYNNADVTAMIDQVYDDCPEQPKLILTHLTRRLLAKVFAKNSKFTIERNDERLVWILRACRENGVETFVDVQTQNPEAIRRALKKISYRPRPSFRPLAAISDDMTA